MRIVVRRRVYNHSRSATVVVVAREHRFRRLRDWYSTVLCGWGVVDLLNIGS